MWTCSCPLAALVQSLKGFNGQWPIFPLLVVPFPIYMTKKRNFDTWSTEFRGPSSKSIEQMLSVLHYCHTIRKKRDGISRCRIRGLSGYACRLVFLRNDKMLLPVLAFFLWSSLRIMWTSWKKLKENYSSDQYKL